MNTLSNDLLEIIIKKTDYCNILSLVNKRLNYLCKENGLINYKFDDSIYYKFDDINDINEIEDYYDFTKKKYEDDEDILYTIDLFEISKIRVTKILQRYYKI
tara:strand:+ start:1622 stop:1927 length:306 start_codon:yes stop_codon:yes gene_type:complete